MKQAAFQLQYTPPPPRQKMVGLSPIGVRKNVILVYVIPEQNNVNQQF